MKKLSILIPAYNEERTIHLILDRIKAVSLIKDLKKELIIVNDCSKDDTEGAIKKYISENPEMDIHYYAQEKNQGKILTLTRKELNLIEKAFALLHLIGGPNTEHTQNVPIRHFYTIQTLNQV